MPIVQIEQDSPELVAQVGSKFDQMVETTRKNPGIAIVAEEFVYGYLRTLLAQSLLRIEKFGQLTEAWQTSAKAGQIARF